MTQRVTWKDIGQDLLQVSSWRGILDLAAVWFGIVVLASLAGRFASFEPGGIVIAVAGVIGIGILQNNLASLSHHAVHWNLHPNRRVSDQFFRWLIAAPMGQNYLTLRREHLAHHASFGAPDDPERHYYDLDVGNRNSAASFLFWTLAMFSGYVVVGQVRRILLGSRTGEMNESKSNTERLVVERREILYVLPAQAVIFAVFFVLTGSIYGYFMLWALPLVTVGAGLNALRATIEHADPTPDHNLYRSFASNMIESFVVGPFKFTHHYEHHRFMTVPYYRIDKVRTILREAGDFSECSLERSYFRRYAQIVNDLRRLRKVAVARTSP
jgi:fatty acid desaturase